ncbi:hypothetical protein ACSSV4_004270 [Roseovarius sp. MBR-154]|jgi:hypothetical protein
MTMAACPDYLQTLLLYYEEEVEGAAYFTELARAFEAPGPRRKLELLAGVERHAAGAVRPLIDKYALIPRPAAILHAQGRAEARATAVDWQALIAAMRESYPGYLAAFRRLESLGPEADWQRLAFLSEHEVAALEFLALETVAPDRSAEPLEAYLATASETWQPRAGQAAS